MESSFLTQITVFCAFNLSCIILAKTTHFCGYSCLREVSWELNLFWRVEKASCMVSGIVAVVHFVNAFVSDAFVRTVEWPTCAHLCCLVTTRLLF